MKIIRLDFFEPGGVWTASATARFEALPGQGPVKWEGDTRRVLGDTGAMKLHNAGTFEEALTAFAESRGLETRVTEEGEWEVYNE
jgi:hypothetical protein